MSRGENEGGSGVMVLNTFITYSINLNYLFTSLVVFNHLLSWYIICINSVELINHREN